MKNKTKTGVIPILENSLMKEYLGNGLSKVSSEHKAENKNKPAKIKEGSKGIVLKSADLDVSIPGILQKKGKLARGRKPKTPDYFILVNMEKASNQKDKILIVEVHQPNEGEVTEKFKNAKEFFNSHFPDLNSYGSLQIYIPANDHSLPSRNSSFFRKFLCLKKLDISEQIKAHQ